MTALSQTSCVLSANSAPLLICSVIPLLIGEPSSATCVRMWNEATRSVSVRLLYPQARAALVRAERMGRITKRRPEVAVAELETIITEIAWSPATTTWPVQHERRACQSRSPVDSLHSARRFTPLITSTRQYSAMVPL